MPVPDLERACHASESAASETGGGGKVECRGRYKFDHSPPGMVNVVDGVNESAKIPDAVLKKACQNLSEASEPRAGVDRNPDESSAPSTVYGVDSFFGW